MLIALVKEYVKALLRDYHFTLQKEICILVNTLNMMSYKLFAKAWSYAWQSVPGPIQDIYYETDKANNANTMNKNHKRRLHRG